MTDKPPILIAIAKMAELHARLLRLRVARQEEASRRMLAMLNEVKK